MDNVSFDIAAETWYQRTHRLREYLEDESKPSHKREQAKNLFLAMYIRMQEVVRVSVARSMPNPPNHFERGGI